MNALELMQCIATQEHLLSLSVLHESEIHSASLFYTYCHHHRHALIVASATETLHVQAALTHHKVSGTIAKATQNISEIKGLQFKGIWSPSDTYEQIAYFKSFPYAIAYAPTIWSIQLTEVKITDNERLGLGRKVIWRESDESGS